VSCFVPGRDSYVLEEDMVNIDANVNVDADLDEIGKKKKKEDANVVEMTSTSNKKTDGNTGGEKMNLVANMV